LQDLHYYHFGLYQQLKKRALNFERPTKDLIKWQKALHLHSKKAFSSSTFDELKKRIHQSRVIYLGDFHTFDQNTKNVERLLKLLLKESEMAIGVEFVRIEHQHYIDAFLHNYITESEFLEEIGYHDSWRFPWQHYRSFMLMARDQKLPVIALNSRGSLHAREIQAAKKAATFLKKHPQKKLLILFGELHLTPQKLPKLVRNHFKPPLEEVIIHQNLDEVYWNIPKQWPLRQREIIRFNTQEFCLQTSPPWIKYESMIYWYEHIEDDLRSHIVDLDIKSLSQNSYEHFLFLCNHAIKMLEWEISPALLEDFNLCDRRKMSSIQKDLKGPKFHKYPTAYLWIKAHLEMNSPCKIPFKNIYYCPHYSVNRFSELVGQHLAHCWFKQYRDLHYEDDFFQLKGKAFFGYACLSFFISAATAKMINPMRKADMFEEIKKQKRHDKYYQYAYKIIMHTDPEKKWSLNLRNVASIMLTARIVGRFLGTLLFEEQGTYQEVKSLIPDWLQRPDDMSHFITFKNQIMTLGRYRESRKRTF
jgi:uncharacterized iron-regulated protein